MAEADAAQFSELSKKLDIIVNILLHFALKDKQFNDGKHKTGELAVWLKGCGLNHRDMATMLGSSPGSIGVLLHLKGSAKKNKKKK